MTTIDEQHLKKLLPETREVIFKSQEERIEYLKTEKWIPYPKANKILEKLEELRVEPKRSRMPSLLLVGESHNGKTSLVKKFWRDNPPTDGIHSAAYPVFYVQAPPVPDERRFYDEIFSTLLVPFRHRDDPSQKVEMVQYYFEKIGTQVLVVDEIHNVLSGSIAKQRAFMNALKNLGNRLMLPIVLVGTKDALMATNTDMQISSRFRPMHLPLWRMDGDFVNLLASIELTLPLKNPSPLATKEIAPEIFNLSEGYIGEIVALVSEAAIVAIETGTEHITMKEIKATGFTAPSKRRAVSELEIA